MTFPPEKLSRPPSISMSRLLTCCPDGATPRSAGGRTRSNGARAACSPFPSMSSTAIRTAIPPTRPGCSSSRRFPSCFKCYLAITEGDFPIRLGFPLPVEQIEVNQEDPDIKKHFERELHHGW